MSQCRQLPLQLQLQPYLHAVALALAASTSPEISQKPTPPVTDVDESRNEKSPSAKDATTEIAEPEAEIKAEDVQASPAADGSEEPDTEDESKYPSGLKLALLTLGLCTATWVVALDNTIIATASK